MEPWKALKSQNNFETEEQNSRQLYFKFYYKAIVQDNTILE